MGRELRRKEAKRNGKNVKEVQKKENYMTPKNLTIIMIVVVLLFALTYLLAGIFITKDIKLFNKKETEEEETTNSISNRILASDSLKQSDSSYYVYYYDTTKEDDEVKSAVYSLTETVYRVDLNDDFNANFIGDPSGVVDSIENLKVSDPTVIKVTDGKITAFYNGKEAIKSIG